MDLIKEYNRNKTFKNDEEFFESLRDIFMFGNIKSEYKSNHFIENKELINSIFVNFLESLLSQDIISNKKEKIAVINFISEFNFRNEILELLKQKNTDNILASKRLGAKFMSSIDEKQRK